MNSRTIFLIVVVLFICPLTQCCSNLFDRLKGRMRRRFGHHLSETPSGHQAVVAHSSPIAIEAADEVIWRECTKVIFGKEKLETDVIVKNFFTIFSFLDRGVYPADKANLPYIQLLINVTMLKGDLYLDTEYGLSLHNQKDMKHLKLMWMGSRNNNAEETEKAIVEGFEWWRGNCFIPSNIEKSVKDVARYIEQCYAYATLKETVEGRLKANGLEWLIPSPDSDRMNVQGAKFPPDLSTPLDKCVKLGTAFTEITMQAKENKSFMAFAKDNGLFD